jgi:hypothetical protein
MSNTVTATVVGGLGNQLFTYAAAAVLAASREAQLRIDTSTVAHRRSDSDTLRAFELPCDWQDVRRLPILRSASQAALTRLRWRIRPSGTTLRKRSYAAPTDGFDHEILDLRTPVQVRGFFQSPLYASALWPDLTARRLHLADESAWYREKATEAREIAPIVLHIRRGDYLHHTGFGTLTREYYIRAVNECRAKLGDRAVWVFTDEPGIARRWALDNATEIRSPRGCAEDMLLMSLGKAIITANSTFSWWSAWMSDPSAHVVVPKPWFRDGSRTGMALDAWTECAADWE